MRLSNFILSNLEEILTEWESFAGTILPEKKLDKLALRDQAEEILKVIALDMETPQTGSEQAEKSRGRGARAEQDSAAESHSARRLGVGFNQAQVVSEYRALRATVIRLWMASSPEIDDSAMDQLIRFNEGMDQALSESTARFMQEIEKSRDFAIAVLAHDLRNPLNAILTSAQYLQRQIAEERDRAAISDLGSSIIASGIQMTRMINNLLDFTRTRLGQPLPIKRELTDLARVCWQIVDELVAVYPGRPIHLNCTGVCQGFFDATRIGEMLSNLIANAIQHGAETTPVTVTARVESEEIVIQVHNDGLPIPPSELSTIFDVLANPAKEGMKESGHLGIGLCIAREIAEAHSGKISVTSTAQDGTTFVVRLPLHTTDDHAA
jgi:signal transduction histidine kinase